MTIEAELDKLQQLNKDYKGRVEVAETNVNDLQLKVNDLESNHTHEVQTSDSKANKTFEQLETAKQELKREQATLRILKGGNATPLDNQANKTLDAVLDKLATIKTEETKAVDEYNKVVDDLLVKSEKITELKLQKDEAYNNVSKVEKEYKPIAEQRKDFFTRTANNDYVISHIHRRYRYDKRMVVGDKLNKALSKVLPAVTTW